MEWVRGEAIGCGSFSTVHLATNSSFDFIAVKSSGFSDDARLSREKSVLDAIGSHRNIIRCLGAEITCENFKRRYNLLFEYAEGGSLADRLRKAGGKLVEGEIRNYTKQMLNGLAHMHRKGFAHLDVKPSNLLLTESGELKIADFGVAERVTNERDGNMVGTPMFMAPESVNRNEYGASCDVWAVGCSVLELATGRPPWTHRHGDSDVVSVLFRIGVGDEIPGVPDELSDEGKDFLRKCFVKDPMKRWTADMLLEHPFLSKVEDESERSVSTRVPVSVSSSPRCVFDFPGDERSPASSTFPDVPVGVSICGAERVRELSCSRENAWVEGENWVSVRN